MSNLRGALAGAIISSGFGLAWSQLGASGLSGAASVATRVAGVVFVAGGSTTFRAPVSTRV